MTSNISNFIDHYLARVQPLYTEANTAAFNAAVSGRESDYTKAAELELLLQKIHADREDYDAIEYWLEHENSIEPLLKRQLEMLYYAYKHKQFDPEKMERIVHLQNQAEQKFSTFRAEVNGERLNDNGIEHILKTETDSGKLRQAWEASKEVGPMVADDVLTLVRLRNEAAREIGYDNYHTAQLMLDEQDPKEIDALFDQLDDLTRDAFAALKREIDASLAARYGVDEPELMPWHYQNRFFQEAPEIYDLDLDAFYADKDVVQLTRDYYEGIGLNVDQVLNNSDLFEKEGKNPHAFCIDIDREGDVRVFCNVKNNASWMSTMLHECGHAVYDYYQDTDVPWIVREPAHTFTTEAIAMLFGRFATHANWLKDVAGMDDAQTAKVASLSAEQFRLEQLVFCRWVQVMYRFERAMYANPEQDLNALWWSLVEKYQLIHKPEGRNEPDWASKIHVALYPAYYHNYMLGELMASQLYHTIAVDTLGTTVSAAPSLAGSKAAGTYLREKVFHPGRTMRWDKLVEYATGEPLTPTYYALQVVGEETLDLR